VQVGDLVIAWVVSVDEKKNRVALTALSPEQRASAAAQEAERKAEREGQRRSGGGRGPASRSQSTEAGAATGSGSGRGQGRGDSRGDTRRSGPGGGGGHSRGNQSGGRGDGRGDGRGRGGRPAHTKTVVVTSKKPKANITAAMKEGEEPLRSFSDLMQFYESKRSDD